MLFFNKDLIRHLIVWNTLYLALTHICFSKVNGSALLKERWGKGFYFFQPQKLLGTIGYHPNIYIIEYLNHSWFFFRHLIIWKSLHFKALTQIWLSKVNGPALLRERWRKGFDFFQPQKLLGTIGCHPNIHIIE